MAEPNRRRGEEQRPEPHEIARQSPWVLVAWVAGIMGAVLVLLVSLDFVFLRGEEVASFSDVRFDIMEEGPRGHESTGVRELVVEIDQVGTQHTLVLSTFPQMLALRWTLTTKEGWPVAEGRDILRSDGYRLTRFVPETAGPHVLRIQRVASQPDHASTGVARPSTIDKVDVVVRVNENSIIKRLLQRRGAAKWWLPGLDR